MFFLLLILQQQRESDRNYAIEGVGVKTVPLNLH
jgi:hypothetical protein